jgi:hypothetical protein
MAYSPLFGIRDEPDQLTVTRNPKKPLRGKVLVLFFATTLFLAITGTLLEVRFMHLKTSSSGSGMGSLERVVIPTIIFLFFFLYLSFLLGYDAVLTRRRKGETLMCDRTSLAVFRAPDSNSDGEWVHENYPVSDIEQLQFGATSHQGLRSSQPFCLKSMPAANQSSCFVAWKLPKQIRSSKRLPASA